MELANGLVVAVLGRRPARHESQPKADCRSRGEDFTLLAGNRRVALDQLGEEAAEGLDAQGQRSHIQRQYVTQITLQDTTLDRRANATTSSGLTPLFGTLPKISSATFWVNGMRVMPPTGSLRRFRFGTTKHRGGSCGMVQLSAGKSRSTAQTSHGSTSSSSASNDLVSRDERKVEFGARRCRQLALRLSAASFKQSAAPSDPGEGQSRSPS